MPEWIILIGYKTRKTVFKLIFNIEAVFIFSRSGLMNKKVILIIVLVLAIILAYSYMSNKHNNKTLKPSAENLINETIKYSIKEIDADYVELSEISKKYSLDDAILDKCYVYMEGREYNKEVFNSFISNVDEGQKSKARVVKGNDASGVVIVDLKYDGYDIEVTEDSTRDTSIKEDERRITTNKYKKEIIKKIDDKSYWILYNNNPDEDYYIVSQVN